LKYLLAMCLKYNGKYAEAVDMFKQYISDGADEKLKASAKLELEGCEMARKAKQPETLTVANIGKTVNSPQTESSPVFSDGQLYFTSLQAKDVITLDGKEGDWYAKIYTAAPGAPGADYAAPAALGAQINREGWNQGNVHVTADGQTMYFTRVEMENNVMKTSKIYYALKGSDGWGAANELVGVNGEYIAKHPAEGELFGEKVLFFVADIPGGEGGYDIYYSAKKTDGVFGLPVNLGKVINTPGEEACPFYVDGKLYFSTNGRPSFGGLDVYESQWNGAVWSAPVNLGPGINSSVDDQFYTRSADGYKGYLVSNRPGPNNLKSKTCCDDIYAWELERIKVDLLATVFRFRRKNERENQPLPGASVQIFDVTEKDPAKVDTRTNTAGNDFPFALQPEKSYMAIATREGYKPDTLAFNTVGVKKSVKIEKKFTLRLERKEPDSIVVTINEPIRLNSIYYDFDDDKILPDAEPDLQYLTDIMKQYPDIKIELSSHTDARGNDDYNQKLSQRRAESARRWLVDRGGIVADRIVAVGYGEKQLLNQCKNGVECTEEEHRFNRRTEFKIISGPTSITIERKEKKE
jgi:peptidoglycan-associated lipoprotein